MFRPVRLIVLFALALAVWVVFFAVPGNSRDPAAFDAEQLAEYETAVWQAAAAHDQLPVFLNTIRLVREQQRYTWFRAFEASYYLARATSDFQTMTVRFERVLPDLEQAATIERDWRHGTFRPAEAARAQLTWWVSLKQSSLRRREDVPALIARDYALRYGTDSSAFDESARYRAEAVRLRESTPNDPDWSAVTRLLSRSYAALQRGVEYAAQVQARARRS